jgi:hypothetical protein
MRYVPAVLIGLVGILVVPLLALHPPPAGPVAVVFGVSVGAREALARVVRAGGVPIAAGPTANVILADGDVGFRRAVLASGAWLLLRASSPACGAAALVRGPGQD